jgi:enoyl-[acyl-carrier-protein] reductase (NADH)
MPTPELERKLTGRIPLGRVGEHRELANLASYLISDYAAYITGDAITIDGGESVWNAGEFNILDELSQDVWDALERARQR